jgi:hypothetical protein
MAQNDVIAQEQKLVGDENLPDPVKIEPTVVDEQVDAQVAQPREADAAKVQVDEVHVQVDEVITDPSDPRAVQVPDAGRGNASTPIAEAYRNGKTVEEVFNAEASSPDEPAADEEPAS